MNIKNFKKLVKESKSFSEVSRKIYGNNYYGNRETIKKRIKEYSVNIDHFTYKPNVFGSNRNKIPLSEILTIDSTYSRKNLKKRLLDEGLKENICEKCGQNEDWFDEKLVMILDHVNGVNNDNRLENLRMLCPNCNSTLSTHGGKNIKNKPKGQSNRKLYLKKSKEYVSNINEERSYNQRKTDRPSYIVLIDEIKDLGYCGTGRKYGVSDNTIRKWIKFYEKYENNTPS